MESQWLVLILLRTGLSLMMEATVFGTTGLSFCFIWISSNRASKVIPSLIGIEWNSDCFTSILFHYDLSKCDRQMLTFCCYSEVLNSLSINSDSCSLLQMPIFWQYHLRLWRYLQHVVLLSQLYKWRLIILPRSACSWPFTFLVIGGGVTVTGLVLFTLVGHSYWYK